jgi:hypothetical protein
MVKELGTDQAGRSKEVALDRYPAVTRRNTRFQLDQLSSFPRLHNQLSPAGGSQ